MSHEFKPNVDQGDQKVEMKSKSGFIAVAGLTFAAAIVLGVVLTPSSFGDGPKSLRGEVDIPDENVLEDIYTVEQGDRYTKAYRQQPPVIPHRADKYEIDLKVNQCMRCHDWPNNVEEGAPKISETHYRDRDGKALDHVYGGRWFCTQCHVVQADAEPIVANTFESARTVD